MNEHEAWLFLAKEYREAGMSHRKTLTMFGLCAAVVQLREKYKLISHAVEDSMHLTLEKLLELSAKPGYLYPVWYYRRENNWYPMHDILRANIAEKFAEETKE